MSPPLHALPFVGALFFLITALALNVTRNRFRAHVSLGDGGNRPLHVAIRAHGNALEHGLVLAVALVLAEVAGLPAVWVVAIGWTMLLARLAHAAGFLRFGFGVQRVGVVVTYALEFGLSAYLVLAAFR
jgi:uncharacterized membrane protein YecN with MAPEG domain